MSWENWIANNCEEEARKLRIPEFKRFFDVVCYNRTRQSTPVMLRGLFYEEMRKAGYTLYEIKEVTGFDHATIIYNVNRISELRAVNDSLLKEVQEMYERKRKEF